MDRQTLRKVLPPEHFESWLHAVNALPQEDSATFVSSLGILPLSVARANGTEKEREKKIAELREHTKNWGRAAVAYIFRADVDPPEPGQRLSELVSAWTTLRQIAEFAELPHAAKSAIPISSALGAGAQLMSDHGKLSVVLSPFFKMLDGVEANRIRLCPICKKLFWAGRRDKSGCSEACSRVLRQRRLRANRAYKKAHPKSKRRR